MTVIICYVETLCFSQGDNIACLAERSEDAMINWTDLDFQNEGVNMARSVTIKGKPYALEGPELKVGQKAPDFRLIAIDMKEVKLSDSKG